MRKLIIIIILTCAYSLSYAQVNIITTICGDDTGEYNGDGILAKSAHVNTPESICIDKAGNVFIADAFNNRIRKIQAQTNIITSIGGTGLVGFLGDGGPATAAEFYVPEAVFSDTLGNIYIADDGNNRIRKINSTTGIITTVAGSGATGIATTGSGGDGGVATNAEICNPSGLCLDKKGNIYIADYGNNKIRKVDVSTGIITCIAGVGTTKYTGTGFVAYSGDGGPATNAQFSGTIQVFADQFNNIFICDQYNHAVRKIDAVTNVITTVAGNGTMGYSGDNGPATNAQLNEPSGLFVDDKENIFIAEYRNGTIRKVDGSTGIITTVVGKGVFGFSGDDGPATNAEMKCTDVWVDKYGTIFIADMDNNRVRMVRDTTLRVGIATVQKSEVKVYPNPANNEVIVTSPDLSERAEVLIYNLWGQQVCAAKVSGKHEAVINVAALPSGMYIINITYPQGDKVIRKFIKE